MAVSDVVSGILTAAQAYETLLAGILIVSFGLSAVGFVVSMFRRA